MANTRKPRRIRKSTRKQRGGGEIGNFLRSAEAIEKRNTQQAIEKASNPATLTIDYWTYLRLPPAQQSGWKKSDPVDNRGGYSDDSIYVRKRLSPPRDNIDSIISEAEYNRLSPEQKAVWEPIYSNTI